MREYGVKNFFIIQWETKLPVLFGYLRTWIVKAFSSKTLDFVRLSRSRHVFGSQNLKDSNAVNKQYSHSYRLIMQSSQQTVYKFKFSVGHGVFANLSVNHTIIGQNYFEFQNRCYIQNKGLSMGAPISAILSEIYLQNLECTKIIKILTDNNILSYFRYVDDILIVYNDAFTDTHEVYKT
jgi:hypothetical protein